NASNASGTSEFSTTRSFTTGFPVAPLLALPPDRSGNTPLDVTFQWHPVQACNSYRIQISRSIRFEERAIVADVEGIADTIYAPTQLGPERTHFWRVLASNAFGNSLWSEIWQFKTGTTTGIADHRPLPVQFVLLQNYPNPFNPTTTIEFSLAKNIHVQLILYDILGKEIQVLVDRELPRGHYGILFNGSNLPAGIYHYRLVAGDYIETKKMALIK
ncbi:MAG: T9SS type A sorting domain-containing protein, partial [bacterium]